jgi:hypothetical protein
MRLVHCLTLLPEALTLVSAKKAHDCAQSLVTRESKSTAVTKY